MVITVRRLACALACALLIPACAAAPPLAGEPPPAAEPAEAPEDARPPAGRVVPLGPMAEGVVADPVTGLVAVGLREPNRLALVDGETGEIRREVPLPGHVRHLQLAAPGGPVLVPAENSDTLLQVSLPDGEVTGRTGVGQFPHDATATASGAVAVADEFGGSVSIVEDGQVVHVFEDATAPGGVAAVGERVGMVDVRENSFTVYDVPARKRLAELPAGEGPTHAIADPRGRVLVTDTRGDAIVVFTLDPEPREIARISLPGSPYGLAVDPQRSRVWVTLTGVNELVGLDVSGETIREVARLPTLRQPNTVAVSGATGRLFIAGPTEEALQIVDP